MNEEKTAEMEKRVEALMAELNEARAKAEKLENEREEIKQEQELVKKLTAEGVKDLEAAILIAKARISKDGKAHSTSSGQAEMGTIIEQMKKEKKYLFTEKTVSTAAMRTSPAKEQRGGTGVLEKSALKAAQTGSRRDVQEYMKRKRVLSF